MLDDIAGAFGLRPDTLEWVEPNDDMSASTFCEICKDWAAQCAALRAELAASRKDAERFRDEI